MNRYTLVLGLLFVALVGVIGAAFWIQNSSRLTEVSLNLGLFARTTGPIGLPVVMAVSFAAGLLLPTLYFGVGSLRSSSRIRRLEQELAMSGSGQADPYRGNDNR